MELDLSALHQKVKTAAERADEAIRRAVERADTRTAWVREKAREAAELCARQCFEKLNAGRASDLWVEDPKVSPIATLINVLALLPREEPRMPDPLTQILKWHAALDRKLWRAFETDQLQTLMLMGETIKAVDWRTIATSRANYSREELRAARPGSWRYQAGWDANFASEAEIARAIKDEAKHRAQEETIDSGTRAYSSPSGIESPAGAGLPEKV